MIPRNFVLLFPVTYTLKGILANNILHKEAKKKRNCAGLTVFPQHRMNFPDGMRGMPDEVFFSENTDSLLHFSQSMLNFVFDALFRFTGTARYDN